MENGLAGGHYVEPYAGGAGVAMELLVSGSATHIHLNDSCKRVFSFWKAILSHTEEFCRRISRAALTVNEWKRQREILRSREDVGVIDLGFSVFYLNRCNRSGILGGGLIGGLHQKGPWTMDARFPRNELIRRVETIASRRNAITILNWDAERYLVEYAPRLPVESLIYLDPPYFNKADRLYLNHYAPKDHLRISKLIRKLPRRWMVSYDAVPEVLKNFPRRRALMYDLHYNAGYAYTGKEVVFLSDDLRYPAHSSIDSVDRALQRRRQRAR